MDLAVVDLIAIITVAAGTVSAFSVLYAKFIRPIKKVVKQVETNAENIKKLEEKIDNIKTDTTVENEFSLEVRGILLESLLSIHDGLEQLGCNHSVTDNKKRLVKFMSSQVAAKRKSSQGVNISVCRGGSASLTAFLLAICTQTALFASCGL